MIKKNKRKQTKRIFPVLLALVMMFSVFTLSAFAEETEDTVCLHGGGRTGSDFNGVDGVVTFWCQECGVELLCNVTVEVKGSPSCGTDIVFSYVDYYEGKEDGSIVGYAIYYCSCVDGESVEAVALFTPIVEDPAEDGGGIVSSIVGDITNSIGVFLSGVGSTLVDFFDNVVTTTDAEGNRMLTTLATWSLVFTGIGFGSVFIKKLMKKAG